MSDVPAKKLARLVEDGSNGEPDDVKIAGLAAEQRAVRNLLGALGADEPDEDLVPWVMARLQDPDGGWWHRLVSYLSSSHTLTIRWRPTWALALFVPLAIGLATLLAVDESTPSVSTAPVTLVFVAPGADSVGVAGDFNGWQAADYRLRDSDGDGVWTITIELERGRYEYMFVVDGEHWKTDPLARARRPDGFGRENAVLEL